MIGHFAHILSVVSLPTLPHVRLGVTHRVTVVGLEAVDRLTSASAVPIVRGHARWIGVVLVAGVARFGHGSSCRLGSIAWTSSVASRVGEELVTLRLARP
jgi:hypothetical protein